MASEVCAQIPPALYTWVPVLIALFILATLYVAAVVAWAIVRIFKASALFMYSGWIRENADGTGNRYRKEAYRFED